MPVIKVLIADAHTLTREGIKSILSRKDDIEISGEAMDSKELALKLNLLNPDIVVIDFYIPGYFSIEDIAFISKNFPEVRIMVISTNQNKQEVLKVFDYGVTSYLLKECEEEEIISAIYAVARKERFFCGRVMDTILEKITPSCTNRSLCDHHCQAVALTAREVEIIRLIAEGYTTKDIANKLFLSFYTIGTHRKNIFKKLRIRNCSELILYALKKGIIVPAIQD